MYVPGIIVISACVTLAFAVKEPKQVKAIDFKYKVCPNVPLPPWTLEIHPKEVVDGKFHVDYKWNISEDAPKLVKVKSLIYKCKLDKENDCKRMATMEEGDLCEVINKNDNYPFVQGFEPKPECPWKKGEYSVTDAKSDTSTIAMFPGADKYLWKIRNELIDAETKRVLACTVYISRFIFE